MKIIKNFIESIENLTKKQILVLGSLVPLGIVFGMALRIGLTKTGGELEKYNTNTFLMQDSLKKDTIFAKRGELYTDTLIDYYRISKKDIKFKTSHHTLRATGSLSIHENGISGYKLLENGVLSKEIIEKNNENRKYSLVKEIIGKDFQIDKLELIKYGTTSNFLDDSFSLNKINIDNTSQKNTSYEIYTRDTYLGNKILDNEQEKVKRYLNEIIEYKKSLK